MTFLAVDVGNTRLKWALYTAPERQARLLAHGTQFLENIDKLADGDWAQIEAPKAMLGCLVASDAVRRLVEEQMELWDVSAQWVLASNCEAGISNAYEQPTRLGADRWVAMIGAWQHALAQGPAQPLLVVMVGTAVTIDAIDASGRFIGGLILPGHDIMLRALARGTAGLNVPTGHVVAFPVNTSDALTSGGIFAIVGAINHMLQQLRQHCGTEPRCIMTGGAGWKVAPSMTHAFEMVDNLLFDGLLEIASRRLGSG